MKLTLFVLCLFVTSANAALVCNSGLCPDCVVEGPTTFTWHVGDPAPPELAVGGDFNCAANGAELDFIRSKFSGIAMRAGSARTVVWVGDDARFVALNIV